MVGYPEISPLAFSRVVGFIRQLLQDARHSRANQIFVAEKIKALRKSLRWAILKRLSKSPEIRLYLHYLRKNSNIYGF